MMPAPLVARVYPLCPASDSIVRMCRSVKLNGMDMIFETSQEEKIVALDSPPELKAARR